MNAQEGFFTELAKLVKRHLRRGGGTSASMSPAYLLRVLRWLTPNGGTLLLVTVLVLTQQVWAKPSSNLANAPGPSATTINYQGRLADAGGNPLDGNYGMTFSLWDALNGGNLAWGPESHAAVPVSNGLFSVGLGSQTAGGIPVSVWDGDRYLEIAVGGETLSPRELIRSVPIAGMALTLPVHTINGTLLADSGFGTSNAPMRNFVVRAPVGQPDLTTTTEIHDAVWDLQPIVGQSAEMVVLNIRLVDNVDNSYFFAWPNGEGPMGGVNGGYVRAFNANQSANGIIWIRCDSQQRLQYTINAAGADSELTELQVTIVGWVEPAATQ